MIHGLVLTHGGVGDALLKVVISILGPEPGLVAASNAGASVRDLAGRVVDIIGAARDENADGVLVFIDDVAGSCATATRLGCADMADVRIVSGVNLAMLLDFTTWRESLELEELCQRLVEKGRAAIGEVVVSDGEA